MSNETEQQAQVKKWIELVEDLGLAPVALTLLEIGRAFEFLGSQALLIAQPLLAGTVDDAAFEKAAALLNSPQLLDRLRVSLEGEESWKT